MKLDKKDKKKHTWCMSWEIYGKQWNYDKELWFRSKRKEIKGKYEILLMYCNIRK